MTPEELLLFPGRTSGGGRGHIAISVLASTAAICFSLVAVGCSPIYSFRLPQNANSHIESVLRSRLQSVLVTRGFRDIGLSERATGDIGCGRTAPDRTTYEKEWHNFAAYHWVWVHEFSCDGAWHIVIVSSTNGEAEARKLRDALSAQFAHEIASGELDVETGHRLALE